MSTATDPSAGDHSAGVHHAHDVQLYEHDESLADIVGDFLATGFRNGEALVVIATARHEAAYRARLRQAGVDPGAPCIEWLSAEATLDTLLVDGRPDEARFRAVLLPILDRHTDRPVRAYGEMVDVLCARGERSAAVELEAHWNALADLRRFSLLCAYALDRFDEIDGGVHLEAVCRAHRHVTPTERYVGLPSEEARAREVAHLQQRARALEAEVARRGALERELRDALDAARRAHEAKSSFLATLGHELRNPLAPMTTALELMRSKMGEVAGRERGVLERQVKQLTRLVDDLLDVSRIARGSVPLRRAPIELAGVIERAIEVASPALEARGHTLHVDAPERGMRVHVDGERMVQVVANLLHNAAKYTPPGGRIEVRGWRDGPAAILSVRDDGIGIDAELLPRVFEPFVQAERPSERHGAGLGVGLAIVRSIVELHGGAVTATSEGPGRGTEIVVRLPVDPAAPALELVRTPARTAGALRILVVDDNADAATVLAELLQTREHEVRIAHDGPSAIEIVRAHPVDVVLTDIGLPDMDGYEVAARLRALPGAASTRIVAITGYGQSADRERSRVAHLDDHLVKPVSIERLDEVLARVTEREPAGPS